MSAELSVALGGDMGAPAPLDDAVLAVPRVGDSKLEVATPRSPAGAVPFATC